MVVVLIIAITAALATPTIKDQMADRRTRDEAQKIARLFVMGRTRALGRGSSVLVRYRPTGFTVLESIEGATAATARTGNANCAAQPGLGCLSNNWTDATLSQQINQYIPQATVVVTARDKSGTAQTQMDLCFTPMGRAFVSFTGTAPTDVMSGVVTVDVQRNYGNGPIGLLRTVAVLPNGAARLGL
jgi:Tfp pilus assembly protein FimT